MEGVELADGLQERILVIGFGRFGQIASQPLLAMKHRVSIIDNDTEMIRAAAQFGFKVYFGDGTRLDVLRAAGAETADAVLICVDSQEAATRIAELVRHEFPLVKVFARAFDRGHALTLVRLGVTYQIREVFESALAFGAAAIAAMGATVEEVAEVVERVRENDHKRFEAQMLGDLQAGRDLLLSNAEDQAREGGIKAEPSEPVVVAPVAAGAAR